MPEIWPIYLLAIVLLLAAWQDIRTYRIANLFGLLVMALFGVWLVVRGVPPGIWENGVHFLMALVVGMGLFALGWIGGGDAKLYAACAIWFNLTNAILLLFFVSLAGLVLLLAMLVIRRVRQANTADSSPMVSGKKKAMRLPYGVAIAAGTIGCMALGNFNPGPKPAFDPTAVSIPEMATE